MRLLYLDLDTLRPDHLGCYGYHRNTSPNIDRIASEGVRFENFYCPDAPCLPSRTAMMSGRFGIHTGVVGHDGTAADFRIEKEDRSFNTTLFRNSLPATLKKAGLKTVYIGGFGERHATYTYYAGFREIHDTGMGGMESAEHVSPTALKWIKQNAKEDNWYLHVNYWDPHTPYRAPEGFGNPFENDPLPDWYTQEVIDRHVKLPGPHTALDIAMWDNRTNDRFPRHPGEVTNMNELRRLIDGYDCGIRYMDDHIGDILNALEEAGVLEDTAIVVSSDHGENLGELGSYAEHGTADNITCRIPMIVRWPGGAKGTSVKGLHYNLDIISTYADLFELKQEEIWDGESFAPAILKGEECGREYLVVSQCAHVCQRGVRWGDYMYIRTYHDGFHLYDEEMLFNLAEDPYEQHNLVSDRKDLCMQGVYYLNEWHDKMMKTMLHGYSEDPLWKVYHEGGPCHSKSFKHVNYEERLHKTGRGYAMEEFRKRHPRTFS